MSRKNIDMKTRKTVHLNSNASGVINSAAKKFKILSPEAATGSVL